MDMAPTAVLHMISTQHQELMEGKPVFFSFEVKVGKMPAHPRSQRRWEVLCSGHRHAQLPLSLLQRRRSERMEKQKGWRR
jgi:hypothetical protein